MSLPLSRANKVFGLSLTRALSQRQPGENLVLSPLSIYFALAMCANGAGGATRSSILKLLELPDSLDAANSQVAKFRADMACVEPGVTFSLDNALWAIGVGEFAGDFLDRCRTRLGAEPRHVSIAGAAPAINEWAARKTRGRIAQIVAADDFSAQTPFALSSATFFDGVWTSRFQPEFTRPAPFHVRPGKTVRVKMMNQIVQALVAREPGLTTLRLPYGKERYAFYGFLPTADETPPSALARMVQRASDGRRLPFQIERVAISLPKFDMNGARQEILPVLHAMGMRTDDFRPMSRRAEGSVLDRVFHKAIIEVDERGTVAAAVTSGLMTLGAPPPPPEPIRFDRPFAFAIADNETEAVLFAGCVYKPTLA